MILRYAGMSTKLIWLPNIITCRFLIGGHTQLFVSPTAKMMTVMLNIFCKKYLYHLYNIYMPTALPLIELLRCNVVVVPGRVGGRPDAVQQVAHERARHLGVHWMAVHALPPFLAIILNTNMSSVRKIKLLRTWFFMITHCISHWVLQLALALRKISGTSIKNTIVLRCSVYSFHYL